MKKTNLILVALINIIFGAVEALIGLRIILKLFGANPAAGFVNWIYETTTPLLSPFLGMFPAPRIDGIFIIEFSALFGLIIYALINYLLVALINLIGNSLNKDLS